MAKFNSVSKGFKEKYLQHIEVHAPKFYNSSHQTHKLKEKLINFFGGQIKLWQPNYKSELVYSSALDTGEAVQAAFEAATSENRILEETALILRRHIQDACNNSQEMPWPSSANFFNSGAISPPSSLVDFLSLIFSGKKSFNLRH